MPGPDTATTPMTAAGKDALAAELAALIDQRKEVVQRIADTRDQGDLRENAGYHQAREDQSRLEGRVLELQALLSTAVIIDKGTTDGTVQLGSSVTVASDVGEITYMIVGMHEADLSSGRLSHLSPVGRALLGRRPGDTVAIQTPGGAREVRVVSVS